jgi:glycosyltransferase involved in cell wall biosynthesis
MTTGFKRLYPTSPLSMRIEGWLERQVVRHADLVVFNVERLRNAYRERYADLPSGKFVFIPNGIVPRAGVEPAQKYDTFTICYTGSLYVGRSPEPVLQAVALLIREGRVRDGCIKVKLVGQCGVIDGVPTESVVARYGLESVVEVHAPLPYEDAFEMIRRSHLALLLAPNLPYQIPAKVYDYLGAGARILAIAEEGGTADLLKETASGRAFRSDEVEAIADFIHAELASRVSAPPSSSVARYDVRRITEDLIAHLTRVSAAAGAA